MKHEGMPTSKISDGVLMKHWGNDTSLIIPDDVRIIGPLAFNMNSSLKEILIPANVKIIDENGFQCCYQVEKITLSPGLVSIGKGAFNNCPKLKEIIIPEGIKEIPDACFFACIKLESVNLPYGLIRIGRESFGMCAIQSVEIPEGVEVIEDQAFSRCWKLSRVSLPSTVAKIGSFAFYCCKYLSTNSMIIPENAEIASDAFSGCCNIGYRISQCIIECGDFLTEVSFEIKDEQIFADVALEKAVSVLIDEYQDLIHTALVEYTHNPDEVYDIHAIAENLYRVAKEYISDTTQGTIVRIKEIFNSDSKCQSVELLLGDVLNHAIDSRMEDEACEVDVGEVVERSLDLLQRQGTWRYGLKKGEQIIIEIENWPSPFFMGKRTVWVDNGEKLEPILWFGVSDKPIKPLVLSVDSAVEYIKLWYEADECSVMESILGDNTGSFLTWYFFECGRCGLDVETIREKCPVTISEIDTKDDICQKIDAFFLCKHNSKPQ